MGARKRAVITGITGQDGSYLAEFLLAKDYDVFGIVRRTSQFNRGRIEHLYPDPYAPERRLRLLYGDMADGSALASTLAEVRPDEVYNLAAQSHVRLSFDQPVYTVDVVATGTLRLLEAVRKLKPMPRFYQASSSEMFGAAAPPQNENTPFQPMSPYACAKVFSHLQIANYRKAYGLFGVSGILFNHESPRRGETFVTRKITLGAARIKMGLQKELRLGNLEARRDWGYAGEYVEAMWLMLQQDEPEDFVIATGKSHSVKDFLEIVFELAELDLEKHVVIDPRFFRPSEVEALEGDARRAQEVLGWKANTRLQALAKMMYEHDLKLARQERAIKDAGLL